MRILTGKYYQFVIAEVTYIFRASVFSIRLFWSR